MKLILEGESFADLMNELDGVQNYLKLLSEEAEPTTVPTSRPVPAGPVTVLYDATTPAAAAANATADAAFAAAAETSVGLEVDAEGFPWNDKIHAGTADKTIQTQKGVWKKRRGVTSEETAVVKAEWLASVATADLAPPVISTTTPPLPLEPPVAAVPGAVAAVPVAAVTPAIDPFAPVPQPAMGPPADPVAACIERATAALLTAGGDPVIRAGISQRIVDAMAAHGVQGHDQLVKNADKAPAILLMLQQLCIERGV